MTSTRARVERLLVSDPGAETAVIAMLDWLESDRGDDPFGDVSPEVWAAVEHVSRERDEEYRTWVERTTWTTAEVVDFLASVNDRKGVDRRRKRGQLIGFRWGSTTRHPIWQFDPVTRDVWDGLALVIDAMHEGGSDGETMHLIGSSPSYDAGDLSIGALLEAGRVDTAVAVAHLSGDQS